MFSENLIILPRLAEEVSNLSEMIDPNIQLAAVDDLYQRIIVLKKIGDELKAFNNRVETEPVTPKKKEASKSLESNSKNKENNRIHIKFLQTKSAVKNKKFNNSLQTEPDTAVEKSPEQQVQKMQINTDVEAKEVDSMDGMFIPSFDEPPKVEDDEDEDGLDITITFPELQKAFNENESHLSACFSSISAEALGHLKRCPKEFTWRMDFIQGEMFFQSGKSPANNYAIGPDLKITECALDGKQSDIISIKSPTECVYASQIIPVGGAIQKESLKILKSTDSELFKVVGLSDVSKRGSSAATKSCITFRNRKRFSSESSFAGRALCKSMPQIPSLIRILEEPDLESVVSGIRTAIINTEQKPRDRILQKKRNNSSQNIV
ncbi:hypothetical protein D910_09547 [Dendroctonus ponderosae]|uniref:Uncharacterized protein n=1 Tax=Dendroctonus ponderosae TaxID=77166 RepID=U4UIK0_DENPD|nr:hypothetical protein D910_09547 [Dendroctonus ponderosae]